ncbi:glycosyltransferase domain-containing protein [Butyrivibrio sp. AE3003]|uniref:glycosyltransferase domain-containing protein n=1 Tax=Butyrivibrio sp. AE3003 TaxID=1496721 RepID=UPI0004796759|nr:glycosyltransferase domain-containing protein [Butyrivibrio sp. AE3003]
MHNAELIKQINEILAYICNNAENMEEDAVRESFLSVHKTLCDNLLCQENKDVLNMLYKAVNENINYIDGLRILAMDAIIKYACADGSGEITKEVEDSLKLAASELDKKNKQIANVMDYVNQIDYIRTRYHLRYAEPSDKFKGKGVVYTVITGDYDAINEPEVGDSELSYILLTDKERPDYNGRWEIRIIDNPDNLDNVRFSRYPKMFPHFSSKSIVDEAKLLVERGKADKAVLDKQIENYMVSGYTSKGYIAELGCIVRDHHDEALKKVMQDWWDEYMAYDHRRDQISFDYVCQKDGYLFDLCDLSVYLNPWMEIKKIH